MLLFISKHASKINSEHKQKRLLISIMFSVALYAVF